MSETIHQQMRRKAAQQNPFDWPRVGDGITALGYSDRYAYTITYVSPSKKRLAAQRDKATLLNGHDSGEGDALQWTPGGFAGHMEGAQRYAYERDPAGAVANFSLRKDGKWRRSNSTARAVQGRSEHYDHNF